MPSPQEILADPNFHALPLGERLKVMRTVDPNFAALPAKDQGTVLYQSAASLHPATDSSASQPEDKGFLSTIGSDLMALPGGVISAAMNPGDTLRNATQARLALRPKAAQALKEGNYMGAAGYGLASMMPFVGPAAAQAGEELGGGQPGQGTAHATELLAPFAARTPEVRAKILPSEETIGTAKEYMMPKRWREANARYLAKKNPPAAAQATTPTPVGPPSPSPTAAAPVSVAPNAPPEGVQQAWWDRLTPNLQQQLRDKIAAGKTQAAPTPGLTAPKKAAPSPLPSPTIPTTAPAPALPNIGDEIEFTQSLGVHGGKPQRAIVTEIRKDPVTGDMVPIVNAGGISLPVAEYPMNGRVVTPASSISKPLGGVNPADNETNLVNMLRG